MTGMRFAGLTAVVTGAGRGMGRAVALALAREGAAVVVAEVDRESADRVTGEIDAAGGRAKAVIADIASVEEFHRVLMAAGYRDNGPPGERPQYHPGYHGAFVLDPDGHNVEAVFHDRR